MTILDLYSLTLPTATRVTPQARRIVRVKASRVLDVRLELDGGAAVTLAGGTARKQLLMCGRHTILFVAVDARDTQSEGYGSASHGTWLTANWNKG